jgi:RNA polymerase sigma-70 factor (ECF subfamily)
MTTKRVDDAELQASIRALIPRLRSFALRLVAHPEDAEDCVQDSLLKATKSLKSFRGESSFETWVFSIVTRTCLDLLRHRRRYTWEAQETARTSEEVDHGQVLAALKDENARFDAREHLAFCFSCVGRTLSPEEAAAVLLKEIFGFSNREAAKISGVSEPVHRHRLAAGRQGMQDVFAKLCGLVSKNGVCHQCKGLRNRASVKRGALPVLPLKAEASYEARVSIVRDADLSLGVSAELHRVMFRAVRKVGEAPAEPDAS